MDDGATDGSSEMCDELAESFGTEAFNIRVIHQPNGGVSAARNAGLKVAEGEYVLFVDSDDTIEAELLSELLDTIEAEPTDMAVFGLSFDYYSGEKLYRRDTLLPPAQGEKSLEQCSEMLFELFKCNSLSAIWNKIIRKNVFDKNNIALREDMFLYEDLEFSLRVLANCENVYFYPEAIYRYRQANEEGNAGRRLMRIPHIPELIKKIEAALNDITGDNSRILLDLYLALAREKIAAAPKDEIKIVCDDFRSWIDGHELLSNIAGREYAMHIYNGDVRTLMNKRRYTKVRHSVANWIKRNFGDFRK